MSIQIIHKNSGVSGKNPTTTQLTNGEIAVNYHQDGPFLSVRDSEGRITRVGGVWMSATAPSNPTHGALWLDDAGTNVNNLYIFDADLGAQGTWRLVGGGGGGNIGGVFTTDVQLVDPTNTFAVIPAGNVTEAPGPSTTQRDANVWYVESIQALDEALPVKIQGSAPTASYIGQLFYSNNNDTLYIWDGAAWLAIGSGGGGGSGSYLFSPPLVDTNGTVGVDLTTIPSI